MITLESPAESLARSRRRALGPGALLFALITVAVVVEATLPQAVVAVVIGVAVAGICLGSPWHGTILVLALSVLFPTPFSVHVAGATLTIGRVALYMLAVGWVVALHRSDASIRLRRSVFDIPMLVFLAVMVASIIANVPYLSHHDLVGAFRRTLVYGVDYFTLFWIVVSLLDTKERVERLVQVLAGLIGFTALLGVIEHFTHKNIFQELAPVLPARVNATIAALAQASLLVRGEPRVISTFEQPLVFGAALGLGFPLALALSLSASRTRRLSWALVAALDVVAMLFTFSRSVLVVGAISYIMFVLLAPSRRMRRWLLVSLVLGGLLVFGTEPSVRHITIAMWNLKPGSQVANTVTHRTEEVGPVLHAVAKRPLLGYGPRTFTSGELAREHILPPPGHAILDNAYLATLGSEGILGLIALALLLLASYAAAWKCFARAKSSSDLLLAIAFVSAVQGWVLMGAIADVYTFDAPPELFFVVLALIAVARRGFGPRREQTAAVCSA